LELDSQVGCRHRHTLVLFYEKFDKKYYKSTIKSIISIKTFLDQVLAVKVHDQDNNEERLEKHHPGFYEYLEALDLRCQERRRPK
jgi:hypothetical protein